MRTVTVDGRTYIVAYTNVAGDDKWGECDFTDLSGILRLHPDQRGKTLLDTVIHEFFHLLLPFAEEGWVKEQSQALTKLICTPEILTQIGLFNNVIVQETPDETTNLE